jgi:CheY-like chemotaxis protein
VIVRRILLVDDSEPLRKLARVVLERKGGFEVALAASGEEGIEAARADPPDLVLLDVLMPGIDGLETLRRLRADPATAAIPVVFLTGRDDEEIAQAAALGTISKANVTKLPAEILRILGEA